MDFSKKIKLICRDEGINLKQFSDLTSIPYDSIRNYSSGKRSPTWEQIYKIANAEGLEKYQQFILSPDSDDPDLSAKIDLETLNQGESELIKALRRNEDKTELLKVLDEVIARQLKLDDQKE